MRRTSRSTELRIEEGSLDQMLSAHSADRKYSPMLMGGVYEAMCRMYGGRMTSISQTNSHFKQDVLKVFEYVNRFVARYRNKWVVIEYTEHGEVDSYRLTHSVEQLLKPTRMFRFPPDDRSFMWIADALKVGRRVETIGVFKPSELDKSTRLNITRWVH